LVVIGGGPLLAVAWMIAQATRSSSAHKVDLPPEAIPDADLRLLVGRVPDDVDVFAAVGLHALNHARSDLVARLADAGFARTRLVHPSAFVDPTATLGENVLVAPHASVGPGCIVDEGAIVLDGARIEAGARVGAYAWIGANVAVGFSASVGAHTILRPGVHLDAGVPVGHHCELATPGLRQAAVGDRTFDTPAFDRPVRIYRGRLAGAGERR
jgi:acyl-[acyl carrier protein]--UDP-N-acetylglucosamine O-acyltransferase